MKLFTKEIAKKLLDNGIVWTRSTLQGKLQG